MGSVGKLIPDVVGLETETSLRIMAKRGVEVSVVPIKDWRCTTEGAGDGPSRVVCQRVKGHWGVVLLVAPDLYRQTQGS